MRKLAGKHLFQMAKIIKAADLNAQIVEILAKVESGLSVKQIGIEAITTLFSACGDDKVEARIYELLDDVFEDKVADMSWETIIEKFNQLARENNLIGFFKTAGLSK